MSCTTSTAPLPPRTLCADLAPTDESVRIEGWVHRRRRLSSVTFVVVRDRTGLRQVVVTDPTSRAEVDSIGEESVVRVVGTATANTQAPGGVELVTPQLTVLSSADTPPLTLWRPDLDAGLPVLLDQASVSWRHPERRKVWHVAAASLRGFRNVLQRSGSTEIQTPKIVGSSTESGANVFSLDYFGTPAYLAQSPQFYKQTMVGVFERVHEIGPVFRAEPHDTVRHLAEYVSLDAEIGFIADHRDVLSLLRDVLAGMRDEVARTDLPAGTVLPEIPDPLPVVHFSEALALVGAPADEPDLAPEHERRLGEWALREFGSDFLAVEGYPATKRPFYTHPQPDDPRWTNSFDLLFRGLELVTGGQRLHRHEDYLAAIAARGEDPAAYAGYLQAFRYGMPPHGGFAIGLERWVSRILGFANIRSATLFPRDLHRLEP